MQSISLQTIIPPKKVWTIFFTKINFFPTWKQLCCLNMFIQHFVFATISIELQPFVRPQHLILPKTIDKYHKCMVVCDPNAYNLEDDGNISILVQYKECLMDNLEKLLQPMVYQCKCIPKNQLKRNLLPHYCRGNKEQKYILAIPS